VLTFLVLLHYGSCERPSLQVVEGPDDSGAQAIADEILTETRDGVGVEVWRGKQRLYVRGVVPPRRPQGSIGPRSAGCARQPAPQQRASLARTEGQT
jgi:hypothetical protein